MTLLVCFLQAGNILIESRGGIKLGDFGVSAYLFDAGDRQRMRNTFVGTPCWYALIFRVGYVCPLSRNFQYSLY